MSMTEFARDEAVLTRRIQVEWRPADGRSAVVAHSLLNAVSCVRISIETLFDEALHVPEEQRSALALGVTTELDRITVALRDLVLTGT